MKNYILDNLIKFISKSFPNYTEIQLKTIRYGLEGIYLTITKTIIIFAIAIYLEIFKELLIIVILYNFLRMFSFGLHANNSLSCLVGSTIIFIGITYLCTLVIITKIVKIIVILICALLFIKYAPADTKKRPIISKKRRLIYKILSLNVLMIYLIIIFLSNNMFLTNAITSVTIVQTFLISPLSYYIFKQPYNNALERRIAWG